MSAPGIIIRAVRRDDLPSVWNLVRGLADYERMLDRMTGSPERLAEALFGRRPIVEGLVAERGDALVGYALFYPTYSSFRTRFGMWLEDLYVVPVERSTGAGRRLLATVARIARARGCYRMDWYVLDWNEPAMGFYRKMGAGEVTSEWVHYGLDEIALARLAGEDRSG